MHSSTGFSPKYLLYGDVKSLKPWELSDKTDLDRDRKIAYENSIKSHENNAKRYNKNKINYNFKIGDEAFVEVNNKLNRCKLDEIRQGPYKISKIISEYIIKLEIDPITGIKHKYHVCKLIPKKSLF